jgi:hypothetical protein
MKYIHWRRSSELTALDLTSCCGFQFFAGEGRGGAGAELSISYSINSLFVYNE